MSLLYYFPGVTEPAAVTERVARFGLHAHPGSHPVFPNRGPDGGLERSGGGAIIHGQPRPAAGVGFWPERQEWFETAAGELWIGWGKDDPPDPERLRRADAPKLDGVSVTLGDGREWFVPKARSFAAADCLPARLRLEDGQVRRGLTLDRYRDFGDRAERFAQHIWRQWWDGAITPEHARPDPARLPDELPADTRARMTASAGGAAEPIDLGDAMAFVGEALGFSYYVGLHEAIALGLFTTAGGVWDAIMAIIDWNNAVLVASLTLPGKAEAAPAPPSSTVNGSTTGGGSEGCCPTTPRPTASSSGSPSTTDESRPTPTGSGSASCRSCSDPAAGGEG